MGNLMKHAVDPVFMALVLVLMVMAGSCYVAFWLDEPELINRIGALLSAFGAAAVLYQTWIETRNERMNRTEDQTIKNLSPFEAQVALEITANRGSERICNRIRIVMAIAIIVFAGEIMHGWGDKIYETVTGKHEHIGML